MYMVWVWGGYVFVLNMVGLHAAFLALTGHFSMGLWKAYSLWYVIGTYGAIQLPVVGLRPLKSLEELAPMGVFFMLHLLAYCEWQRGKELGLLAPGDSSSAVPCGRIDVGRAGWRAGQAPGAAPLDLVCVCAGRGRGDGAGYCSIASAVSVEQRARVSIAECLFRHCGRGVVDVRQVPHPT